MIKHWHCSSACYESADAKCKMRMQDSGSVSVCEVCYTQGSTRYVPTYCLYNAEASAVLCAPPPALFCMSHLVFVCTLHRLQHYKIMYCVCCRGSSNALNGCINDAHCMMFLLKSRFQFQDSDFRVLTDDQASPSQWPTRANMFEGFRWLAADARPGDSLVFHYSGKQQTCVTPLHSLR